MRRTATRARTRVLGALTVLPLLTAVGCASQANTTASDPGAAASEAASLTPGAGTCAPDQLDLHAAGQLTVGTDSPAYDPWFSDNDPTDGKGFESAVAYAVAQKLGFTQSQVHWTTVRFNSSYKPGPKDFDFDINQISITPDRAKVVDFSTGYYTAEQAVITLKDSPLAGVTSLADLAGYKLGAQTGTTSLTAIRDDIKPSSDPVVFQDTNGAKQALVNHQVDAIVADLPTAFYISAAEIPNSTILGQFQTTSGEPEQFGMLLQKGSGLTKCVDAALGALKSDGTLAALEKKWLSDAVDVPSLN